MKHTGRATQPVKSMEISAVKILADGTRIDLGVLSTWHRNPIIRGWRNLKLAVARRFR